MNDLGLWFGGVAVAFVLGVVFGQKIKDFFLGVPSELRAALNQVQSNAVATVKATNTQAIQHVAGLVKRPVPVALPAAPAAAAAAAAAAADAPAAAAPAASAAPAAVGGTGPATAA